MFQFENRFLGMLSCLVRLSGTFRDVRSQQCERVARRDEVHSAAFELGNDMTKGCHYVDFSAFVDQH